MVTHQRITERISSKGPFFSVEISPKFRAFSVQIIKAPLLCLHKPLKEMLVNYIKYAILIYVKWPLTRSC